MGNAIDEALEDSNIPLSDVDGFSASTFETRMENVTTLAHHFGIDGRWFLEGTFGGASAISGLLRGAKAIERGDAETVVVASADATTPDSNMNLVDSFNISLRNGMTPYGFGGTNGLFAMLQQRHSHEYGTTREQLGHIATTLRSHARRNPNAILQDPMSMEDYLDARPIVEPIHLFDCVLPCGGGGAYVLTTRENASAADAEPTYILSGDEYHNPNPTEPFALSTGLKYCTHVFDDADVSRDDIDCIQLYDDYPIMVAIQLEDLGFCEKGEGGPFVEQTDLSVEGELSLNTGGGQLSMGQAGAAGGILGPIEAIRQLRGDGADRQVPDCSTALSTGFGMVAYGGGLSSSTVILSNEDPKEGDDD
jgi:acetyl-CoA acetyltransferase